MIRSLRARLLLGTVGATLVFLVAVGFALYGLVGSALRNEFDARLASKTRILSIMVVEGEGWYKLVYERSHFPEYERQQDAEYFQLWRGSGQVFQRAPSLGRHDLPQIAGPVDAPAFTDVVLADGRPGRAAGIRFTPRREDGDKVGYDPRKEMVLVVAQATEPVEARLNRFRWLLGGVFTAAMLAAAAAQAWVVTSLLRPLEHLANRIARLDADDLSARFAAAYLPSELRPVARRLDDQRQVAVVWQLPGAVFVESDPDKLRIVVSNLFDNAVSYVPDQGTVTISVTGGDATCTVTVANTGSTLPADQVVQVFDRFWRGDRSRAIGLHCGLGLSLCQRIVALLGGTIVATSSVGGVFAVTVTLPRGVLPADDGENLAS